MIALMRLLMRRAMVAAAAAGVLSSTAQALTPAQVFEKVSASVWLLRAHDKEGQVVATGSAVVVAPQTLVTNCHVLQAASSFVVVQGEQTLDASLMLWDLQRDICQVHAPSLNAPAVETADTRRLAVGEPVYAIGAPLGLELTLSAGLVSSLRKSSVTRRLAYIHTSAPMSPGSSGGGLFDEKGRLIGITTFTEADVESQDLNFAIPINHWYELPQRHQETRQRSPMAVPGEKPAPVWAIPQSIRDRVPFLSARGQAAYENDFLSKESPRAFAISDEGAWGYAWLGINPRARALWECRKRARKPCMLYVLDDKLVYRP